jgi:1-acyl-sn-glycerol-3-phosphate acyltransferase
MSSDKHAALLAAAGHTLLTPERARWWRWPVGAWRMARVLACVLRGWAIIRWRFPALSGSQRGQQVQAWSQRMLRAMGIDLVVHGTPTTQGAQLVVSNHLSWLDIIALHAAQYMRFVSKAEVKHWPLVGTLATGAGTLYIERESRRDALRVVHHMADALTAGDALAVFPEGTTSDGVLVLPFHGNLLQAAVATGAPLQPLGLRFVHASTGKASTAPLYIGDDSLLTSMWRTLCADDLQVHVRWGAPIDTRQQDRRTLAAVARTRVAQLAEAITDATN